LAVAQPVALDSHAVVVPAAATSRNGWTVPQLRRYFQLLPPHPPLHRHPRQPDHVKAAAAPFRHIPSVPCAARRKHHTLRKRSSSSLPLARQPTAVLMLTVAAAVEGRARRASCSHGTMERRCAGWLTSARALPRTATRAMRHLARRLPCRHWTSSVTMAASSLPSLWSASSGSEARRGARSPISVASFT